MAARRKMLLVFSVLGILGVAAAPAPALTQQSTAGDQQLEQLEALRATLPANAVVATEGGVDTRHPLDALLKPGSRPGVAGRVDALARVVAENSDHPPLVVLPEEDPEGHPEEVEAYEDWSRAAAVQAGDLNGDGAQDAIVYVDRIDDSSVEAVDGKTGDTMWSAEMHVGYLWPVGVDLTGDGRDDVIRFDAADVRSSSWSYCGSSWCTNSYSGSYRARLAVVEGSTGHTTWRRSWNSSYSEEWSYARSALESRWTYSRSETNAIGLFLGSDFDGDSIADLVTNALDLTFETSSERTDAWAAWQVDAARTLRSATHAALVNGATGRSIATRSSEDRSALAILRPVGDVVGDEREDLLWTRDVFPDSSSSCLESIAGRIRCEDEPEENEQYGVEVVDGATLDASWARVFAVGSREFTYSYTPDVDFDGDGKDDVLYETVRFEMVEPEGDRYNVYWTVTTEALSGRDGTTLWEADDLNVLDYVEAEDGADLVVLQSEYPEDGTRAVAHVSRVDGATGETLSSWQRAFPLASPPEDPNEHAYASIYAFSLEDADGDGAREVATGVLDVRYREDEGSYGPVAAAGSAAVDTADGSRVLWQGNSDSWWSIYSLGDLDGDGLADIIEGSYGQWGWQNPRSDRAQRIVDGRVLWELETDDGAWLGSAGDQDGDGGNDLLLSGGQGYAEDERPSATVESRSGATGELRWSRHYESSGPHPVPVPH